MAIAHRRIFQAKIGMAEALIQHFQEAGESMKGFGVKWETRILTDYHSGRSDRVAIEWVVESIEEIERELGRIMEIPEAGAFFGEWMTKLNTLVLHSDAENWRIV